MSTSYAAAAKATPRQLPRADHPFVLFAVFLAVAAFLLGSLQPGEDWAGDAALYILDARNIVLGLPYGHTGYVPNPANPINPAAYPPGLPLLLAPIYWTAGVHLYAMKMLCVVCFLLFLVVFWRIARDALTPAPALLTVVALGMHPFIWYSGRFIASEFPFMLFCYAGLYAIDQLQRAPPPPRLGAIAAASLAVALACITRTIGVVIFPAAILAAAPDRKHRASTFFALVAAGVLMLAAQITFPGDLGTYTGYFQSFGPHSIATAVRHYLGARTDLLGTAVTNLPIARKALTAALIAVCALGFLARARQRMSVFEWFALGYGCFLLLYPVSDEASRYSLPLWPLLFLYCAAGLGVLGDRLARAQPRAAAARPWAAAVIVLVVAGLYVARYRALNFGPIRFSIDAPESRALYEAIRAEIPSDATILSRKPTVIALFAQRRAIVWSEHFTDPGLWQFMDRNRVGYLVQDNHLPGGDAWPPDELDLFIARNRGSLTLLFSNPWFRLYRVVQPAVGAW